MEALKRVPWQARSRVARIWGARGLATQQAQRMERGPDWETVRKRAAHDMRGVILRHGVTYSSAQTDGQPWAILRSKAGRLNQVDVHAGGMLVATCALRSVERGMKRAKL